MDLREKIRSIPDFPKKGIIFRDITTLLKDSQAFNHCVTKLARTYQSTGIDLIAGIESRGFIFGAALALELGKGFIPIRKPGKLPAEVFSAEYSLEYGTDRIEMHADAVSNGTRVLLVDDLLATGGTMQAACSLIEKAGGEVVACAFVIHLTGLKGEEKLGGYQYHSLMQFD